MSNHPNELQDALMLSDDGRCLRLTGKISFGNAAQLYLRLRSVLKEPVEKIDCSAVQEADSTALALLLVALHLTQRREDKLKIVGLSAKLQSLADVYGIASLL